MSPEVTRAFASSTLFFHVSNWNTEPSMSPPVTSRTKSDWNWSPFWYIRLTIKSSFVFIWLPYILSQCFRYFAEHSIVNLVGEVYRLLDGLAGRHHPHI